MGQFNGAGHFNRSFSFEQDAANEIGIVPDRMDEELDGLADGLSNCITRDGQTTIIANIDFNNRRIIGLADAVADTDALNRRAADARYFQKGATAGTVPVGAVVYRAGSPTPEGFIPANGALVSRAAYADLWGHAQASGMLFTEAAWVSAPGGFAAGDGSTTFRIPDLRGDFLRGLDGGRGIDASRALGSLQADAYRAHTHVGITLGGGTTLYLASTNAGFGDGLIGLHPNPGSPAVTASSGGAETRPRNVAYPAFIKF